MTFYDVAHIHVFTIFFLLFLFVLVFGVFIYSIEGWFIGCMCIRRTSNHVQTYFRDYIRQTMIQDMSKIVDLMGLHKRNVTLLPVAFSPRNRYLPISRGKTSHRPIRNL